MNSIYFRDKILTPLYLLCAAVLLAIAASAQDKENIKVYAGFGNLSSELFGENLQGINLSGQYKVYGYEQIRLEVVGDFGVFFRDKPQVDTYQYLGGPQVGVSLFENRLTPFARLLFGSTRNGNRGFYTHSIGGGVDINLGRVFVRPIQYDSQTIDTLPFNVKRVGAGLGLRF